MSISNYAEAQLLDAVFNADPFSVASTFIKLHNGDPGEDCINNPAVHTTRMACTWTAASSGSVSNDIAVTFTPMAASETITHISVWDTIGPAGGNPLWYGALSTPQVMNIDGTLNFAIGSISVSLS